jgi:hypothetical protein
MKGVKMVDDMKQEVPGDHEVEEENAVWRDFNGSVFVTSNPKKSEQYSGVSVPVGYNKYKKEGDQFVKDGETENFYLNTSKTRQMENLMMMRPGDQLYVQGRIKITESQGVETKKLYPDKVGPDFNQRLPKAWRELLGESKDQDDLNDGVKQNLEAENEKAKVREKSEPSVAKKAANNVASLLKNNKQSFALAK